MNSRTLLNVIKMRSDTCIYLLSECVLDVNKLEHYLSHKQESIFSLTNNKSISPETLPSIFYSFRRFILFLTILTWSYHISSWDTGISFCMISSKNCTVLGTRNIYIYNFYSTVILIHFYDRT